MEWTDWRHCREGLIKLVGNNYAFLCIKNAMKYFSSGRRRFCFAIKNLVEALVKVMEYSQVNVRLPSFSKEDRFSQFDERL